MSWAIVYKPLAEAEINEALDWYSQDHIGMSEALVADLRRVEAFIADNPQLYPRVTAEIRRANLGRFPYSLFYVVEESSVIVLSLFHQHRDPKSRGDS